MKKPPLILISGSTASKGVEFGDASLSLSLNYALAIRAAAGMPWLLPCVPERELVAEAVRRSDGVMLTGGDDVQPSLYSAKLPPAIEKTVHAPAPLAVPGGRPVPPGAVVYKASAAFRTVQTVHCRLPSEVS